MQKLINLMAVVGFLGTAGIAGVGVYVYINQDALIENAKGQIAAAAAEAITGALPGIMDAAMPEIPEMPKTTGGAIPGGGGAGFPGKPF